jgi:uncharacterized protein (DUF1330 family)
MIVAIGLFFVPAVHGAISSVERSALIALYNATNGDSWNNKNNWKGINPEPDGFSQIGTEGTWYSITVESDHVTKIILFYNNLVGSIPTELGNLTGLTNLTLRNNQLSGSIPVELGNLTNLQYLYLNSNQLSGAIPEELGNLTQLKVLLLNNNYLGGPIPTSLTNLNNLLSTGLDIGTNCLCACDDDLRNWLDTHDPDWETNQSHCTTSNITVTSPNGGENWIEGEIHNITWNPPGNICSVMIEYSVNNGATWSTINESTLNDGSYSWTVPNTPSTTCKVRISDAADGTPSDQSNAVFTISLSSTQSITVTTPNGGEVLQVNTGYYINWSSGGISNIKIEYTANNGNTWDTIVSSTPNSGSYNWTVPNTPSTNCKVRISDAADGSPSDVSDSVFTINAPAKFITLLSPNGGENCKVGSSYTITWTSVGISANVKIDYSTNGSPPWTTVVSSTPDDGTYTWTVPNTPAANCKVRVSDAADPTVIDSSDAVFSIVSTTSKPTVTTNEISSITSTSAVSGGNVVSDGGASVTARGVCWSTTPDPTVSDSKTSDGTGTGTFTSSITGLSPNTTYYLRAYATNSSGTSYGTEKSFKTFDSPLVTYTLYVKSSPVTGVSIDVSDNNGLWKGTTNFSRAYNPGQTVTLTAPGAHMGKNFLTWKVDGVNRSGQTIIVTMDGIHTAQAIYQSDTYTLAVQSSPQVGVPITVTPPDNNNQGDGNTEFFRIYPKGTIVTLTADTPHSGKNFVKWLIDGAANTNRTVNITMNSNHTAQAVYESPTYILSVQSSPDPGIAITVTPADQNGKGNGTTNFTRDYTSGTIITLTAPSKFNESEFIKWTVEGIDYTEKTIQVTMDGNHTASVYYETPLPPVIGVSRRVINLGYIVGSSVQPEETFTVFNSGGGTLNWTLNTESKYLSLSPTSGTNCGVVQLEAEAAHLEPGEFTERIYVSAPLADNSPVEIEIHLGVKSAKESTPPFGEFATPIDGTTVSSSIPVTGWVLSDTGMQSVKIYRQEGTQLVYIGDANFVEGARPDVEAAYPDYPMNYKAGWGYMMLTNFLPNGGNGTFKIYAQATDREGRKSYLGIKTITVDNAHAIKPFGAIDTPDQGGTASGSRFINWGWALTPRPNSIPTDGTTLNVYVDGVKLGHPVYNISRSDIAGLFPGYANSSGAAGYFYLDTTAYADGQHTIQWTATDNAGNTDGIGSRYFTINNACGTANNTAITINRGGTFEPGALSQIPPDYYRPVLVWKGNRDLLAFPGTIYPNDQGIIVIETRELEPLEIHFFEQENPESLPTLEILAPAPIGSKLDRGKGIFYWQPGPGFIGKYRLVFVEICREGQPYLREIQVKILPKFDKKEPGMDLKQPEER